MDEEIRLVVATPFRKKGVTSLSIKEFEFALSFDLKWMAPPLASKVRDKAISAGLLRLEGNKLVLAFDISQLELPNGFKPSPSLFTERTILQELVSLIATQTGNSEKDVMALINGRQEKLGDIVDIEVAALIAAKDEGCDVTAIHDKLYAKLFRGKGS